MCMHTHTHTQAQTQTHGYVFLVLCFVFIFCPNSIVWRAEIILLYIISSCYHFHCTHVIYMELVSWLFFFSYLFRANFVFSRHLFQFNRKRTSECRSFTIFLVIFLFYFVFFFCCFAFYFIGLQRIHVFPICL